MRRKRILGIGLIALVLIAGAVLGLKAWDVFGLQAQETQPAAAQTGNTDPVQISLPVSGSGTLEPAAEVDLSFPQSGVLVELNVRAGDLVEEGDLLARLQIDKTPAELAAGISAAELALLSAQRSLEALYEEAGLQAAEALYELEAAQQDLENLQDNTLEAALAAQTAALAAENVADAEMQYYIVQSDAPPEALDIAEAALLFKEKDLTEIEKQIARLENQIKGAPNNTVRDMLKSQLLNLQVRLTRQQLLVDQAADKLENLDDAAETYEIDLAEKRLATAQLQLDQARRALEDAQAGPAQGELIATQVRVAEAEAAWQRLKDGPDEHAVAMAEAEVAAARARLALAEKESLTLDLTAPVSGTILSGLPTVGTRISVRETVATLVDLSQPTLEVFIDESDLSGVQVGFAAEVTFDAFPDEVFAGRVVDIYPQLVGTSGGSKAVLIRVRLEESPARVLRALPVGLNATVDIKEGA